MGRQSVERRRDVTRRQIEAALAAAEEAGARGDGREAIEPNAQKRASIGFRGWSRDSLQTALTGAGVPVGTNPSRRVLEQLARDWFEGGNNGELPTTSDGLRVRYTSRRTGVKYVEGPMPALRAERRPSNKMDPFVYARESPAQADAPFLLGTLPPPASFRHMESLEREEAQTASPIDLFNAELQELEAQNLSGGQTGNVGQDIEREFLEPSEEVARKFADQHHPRQPNGKPYSLCGTHAGRHGLGGGPLTCLVGSKHSDLARFGLGVSLYFKWLKWLVWVFVLLSVATGPQLYYNVTSYRGDILRGLGLLEATVMASISELGLNRSVVSSSVGGNKFVEPFLDCNDQCQADRAWLAYLYAGTDLGAMAIFLLALAYLAVFEQRETRNLAKRTVSVNEYTVQLVNPPPGTTEADVGQFFADLTGEPVHEVYLARNSGKLIRLYVERGRVIHKMWKAATKVYRLRNMHAQERMALQRVAVQQRRSIRGLTEASAGSASAYSARSSSARFSAAPPHAQVATVTRPSSARLPARRNNSLHAAVPAAPTRPSSARLSARRNNSLHAAVPTAPTRPSSARLSARRNNSLHAAVPAAPTRPSSARNATRNNSTTSGGRGARPDSSRMPPRKSSLLVGAATRDLRRATPLLSMVRWQDALNSSAERTGLIESRLHRAVHEYDQLYAQFDQLNQRRITIKSGTQTRTAFITFETQVGYLRCLDLFPVSGLSKTIKFKGRNALVRPAPPPSTILWENFDYGWWNRFLRRGATMFMALLVIGISTVLTYLATVGRQVLKTEIATSECVLPGAVGSVQELQELVESAVEAGFESVNGTATKKLQELVLECTCGLVTFSEAAAAALETDDPCHPFWVDKAPLFGYTFLITAIVSATNLVIRLGLSWFAQFEKHHSMVSMQLNLTSRVFLTLLINTGLVILVVNYDFAAIGLDPRAVFDISGYADFVPNWYSDVGVQMLLVMLVNVLAPHLFTVAEVLYARCVRRNRACCRPSSQRQLNEWYTGPVFNMHYRLAHNLMTVFITLIYGPGLPLLYPLAALSFAAYYWVDKWMLLRHYRTPPRYDGRPTEKVRDMMLYAVGLNVGAAMLMYSSPGFFWFSQQRRSESSDSIVGNAVSILLGSRAPESTIEQLRVRLSLPFMAPLLAFFLVYLFVFALYKFVPPFRGACAKLVDLLCCKVISRFYLPPVMLHPPLPMARQLGILRGVPSYSILANPIYTQAFGVDDRLAQGRGPANTLDDLSEQVPVLPMR